MDKNKKMKDISILDFQSLKILLAGDKEINDWSYGEVTKPETINYRTLRPEKDGLFDERIFGPTKDWECYCGKYKRIRYRGIVCDKCGVEVTLSRVRRERMGHIGLAAPVAHVWYFKGSSSSLSLILNMSQKDLESVIYYASYLVTDVDEDKKKKALEGFAGNVDERKDNLKKDSEKEEDEVNKDIDAKLKEIKTKNEEQKKLMEQELELSRKQRLARISDRVAQESKKIDEIADALNTLVKSLKPGSVLSEDEYFKVLEYDIPVFFTLKTGAEGLLELIEKVNIDEMIVELRKEVEKSKGQKYLKLIKRLRLLEVIRKAGVKPKDMVYTALPVIPPDLRPMVQLSGGRFATSDLNDLYRRVINRNNRLKHLMSLGAPEIILRNEKRMLQESVDSLIDASQRGSQVVSSPLRSLSDMLRGKQGRFRQNLLGKRVDYSGRSVIVVGPDLKLSECGLPKEMALEMFKPFVLREVIVRGYAPNIKSAKRFIEKRPPEVFDILEEITKDHPVLLNRAPTLHKLGIQAFYPKLIEGAAIQLHPCVCKGYNADFDGDQMAVHIPLSENAQKEAVELMMPRENLLKPADGAPITLPDKEMAIGIFYLTTIDEELRVGEEEQKYFANINDALLGFSLKKVSLREPVRVKIDKEIIETTIGRLMLNEYLPDEIGFVNRPIKASGIKELIIQSMNVASSEEVEKLIDRIKTLGFYGSTVSGISVSVFDTALVAEKQELIDAAEVKIADIDSEYQQGLITNEERKRLSNEVWMKTTEQIADMTWDLLTPGNVIRTIIDSEGARAGKEQLKQLSAMRGLILDPLGKIVELPIKSNFREGLSIFEYVSSARGSRKGLTDSALKTANAGYLTRRLVDVSHDMIIREEDCGTKHGITVNANDENRTASFKDRILGRIAAENITAPKGKKVIVKAGEEINDEKAAEIMTNDVEEAKVRSVITCELKYGICSACYGWDFSVKRRVALGVPVGVIAAQSIGEPGTQLTMRVRHFGGVVMSDVTQGLPRVEELFEMRTPKALSPVAELSGKLTVESTDDGNLLKVKTHRKPAEEREYFVPKAGTLLVKDGQEVTAGTQFAQGYMDPKEVLKITGLIDAQKYVITEAQKVYESQGIPINDKHFEVILRKMSDKVVVETVGDTTLIPGDFITRTRFEEINAEILSQGGEPATARQTILGVTKSSLFSDSWLSAASFQETTKVLTEASLEGAEDKLIGLKENVIIGRLIPVEGIDPVEVEESGGPLGPEIKSEASNEEKAEAGEENKETETVEAPAPDAV